MNNKWRNKIQILLEGSSIRELLTVLSMMDISSKPEKNIYSHMCMYCYSNLIID